MKLFAWIAVSMVALAGVIVGAFYLGMHRMEAADQAVAAPADPAMPAHPTPPPTTTTATRPTDPPATRPAKPRPIVLKAADAKLTGNVLRLSYEGTPEVCYWVDPKATVQWPLTAPKAGQYKVEVVFACEDGHGGDFVIAAADQQIAAKTHNTGGPHHYQTVPVGTLTLNQTPTTLTVKPAHLSQTLMNLRAIRLTAVE